MSREQLKAHRRAIENRDGRIPPTLFVVVGRPLAEGLNDVEAVYPGIMQPGDTAFGMHEGRPVIMEAHRENRWSTLWRIAVDPATAADVDAARARARDVLTIAGPGSAAQLGTSIAAAVCSRSPGDEPRALAASAPAQAQARGPKSRARTRGQVGGASE